MTIRRGTDKENVVWGDKLHRGHSGKDQTGTKAGQLRKAGALRPKPQEGGQEARVAPAEKARWGWRAGGAEGPGIRAEGNQGTGRG